MNPIRRLRLQTNLTQHELADQVGTSQPTIAAYESGAKSPTLRTVQRFAAALGLELLTSFAPPMTREELRSLAYHQAISERLHQDPSRALQHARGNLAKLRRLHPHAEALFDRWAMWLDLPLAELTRRILSPDPEARELRHVSPFSGVLTARERAGVLKAMQAERAR